MKEDPKFICDGRVVQSISCTMYDESGHVVICSRDGCKNESAISFIGKKHSLHLCTKHYKEVQDG